MKELSIEEKAKAYDEALKQIKECTPDENGFITIYPQEIFPELKEESEDEQIRKALITTVIHASTVYGATREEVLAWLEKQNSLMKCLQIANARIGELIEENYYLKEKQCEQKHADKVEPKFKVGDWLVHNERKHIVKVVNHTPFVYVVVDILGYHNTIINDAIENNYHLWTIQDAKDGDVLYFPCQNLLWIYEDAKACYYNYGSTVIDKPVCIPGDVYPATKEQRDLLFAKMKEASYEWDAEKKELRKIEQTSTWSEEDEQMIEAIIQLLYDTKSENCWNAISVKTKDKRKEITFTKIENWLKSLKERVGNFDDGYKVGFSAAKHNQWKPSDEQMEALESATENCAYSEYQNCLRELIGQLKKLRED